MDGVLKEVRIPCSYDNIKTAIQSATKSWISSLIKGYPEDLSEFIDNVVNREFNLDSNAIYTLKNENTMAVINCPHAKVTIGELMVNGKTKNIDKYGIEFWYNKTRLKYNPEENVVNVFHRDQYGRANEEEYVGRRRGSKVLASMTSVEGGSKEFLEIAVKKKEKNRKRLSDLMFREERKKQLRDSFVGRMIIPLTKAFEFNQKNRSWPLTLGRETVGSVDLCFNFVNQDMLSSHDLFISQISCKVLENFNELWQLNKTEPMRPSVCQPPPSPFLDKNADFTEQPLRCHVELTLVGEVLEKYGSSKNLQIGNLSQGNEDASIMVDNIEEDGKRCEDMEENKIEISINNKKVESDVPDGTHYLIPVHSFMNDVVLMETPLKKDTHDSDQTFDEKMSIEGAVNWPGKENENQKEEDHTSLVKVPIRNIPWKGGQIIPVGSNKWRLEFVCSEHGYCDDGSVPFVEVVKCLVFLLFHKQLSKKENQEMLWWNGRLGGNLISVVSVIYPFFTGIEWEAIESWALLKLAHFFESLNLSLVNRALKCIKNKEENQKVNGIINPIEKEDIIKSIASMCLHRLSVFDFDEEEEKMTSYDDSKKLSSQRLAIDQARWAVKNLTMIYKDSCSELLEQFGGYLSFYLVRKYADLKDSYQHVPFSKIILSFSSFEKYLCQLSYQFGFFGRAIWCSILSAKFFEMFLPLVKNRMDTLNQTQAEDIQEVHTNLLLTFKQLKSILPYCAHDKEKLSKMLHTLFEPYLIPWSRLVVLKAEKQIDEVIRLEKDKFANKDVPDSTDIKKNMSGFSNLSVIYEGSEDNSWLAELEELKELEGARHVRQIFQTCVKAWENLEWDDSLKKTEFGVTVFLKLHYLFIHYIEGLKSIALENQRLDLDELVYILKSLFHLQQEYIVIFWKKLSAEIYSCQATTLLIDKETSDQIIQEVRENVNCIKQKLIHRFSVEKQEYLESFLNQAFSTMRIEKIAISETGSMEKTFFFNCNPFAACCRKQSDEEDDGIRLVSLNREDSIPDLSHEKDLKSMKEHVENIISDFEHQVGKNVSDSDIDSTVIDDVRSYFKGQIYQVHLDNLKKYYILVKQKYIELKNSNIYKFMESVLKIDSELRKNLNIENASEELTKIAEETILRLSSSSMLISNYLNCLYDQTFNKDSHAGTVTYRGGVIGGETLLISLKSVANLRPRLDEETCNFSIEGVILPGGIDGKSKQSTPTYKETTFHLFDMGGEDEGIPKDNQFSFSLPKEYQVGDPIKMFAEFRVYDHSTSFCRKKKFLLGHVFQPVDVFPEFESLEEFGAKQYTSEEGIFKNYNISDIVDRSDDDKNETLCSYWNELKCREDKVAISFVEAQNRMESLSLS